MRNPFGRKKTEAPAPRAKAPASGVQPSVAASPAREAGRTRRFLGVIRMAHITEKSNAAMTHGWYTFAVGPAATKGGVKAAVEERYGVHVTSVRMIRARSREVRLGRILGKTPGVRKAMVKLRNGEAINLV